ncbi:hypothetical protein ACQ3I4_08635 [Zafaria sp. Z1313]|uniref:hypothetical protein n=1 Tax=unclassified Zafaria TaxID=2828765 RepID=UPI002E792E72|nr:hypothetical protein [Zafaria sp. J156]MEE1621734.1 hypothetical protein [Zafaria sp. J156]
MDASALVVVAAAISVAIVVGSCVWASRRTIGYVQCLLGLFFVYAGPLAAAWTADYDFDETATTGGTLLSVSAALLLGSALRPIRPIIYMANLVALRFEIKESPDYEENKTARRETRWYALAAAILFVVLSFTTLPALDAAIRAG